MKLRTNLTLLTLVAAALVGCATSHKYDVSLTNQTAAPVTLWLTKDGPPLQEGWLSPEDLARVPRDQIHYDFANILPGKTGYTGEVSGQFDKNTHAVLRVYPGNLDLVDILRDKPKWTPYTLKPGKNDLVAIDENGNLVIKPAASP